MNTFWFLLEKTVIECNGLFSECKSNFSIDEKFGFVEAENIGVPGEDSGETNSLTEFMLSTV